MPNEIPIEELRRLLRYDPETGRLFWRVDRGFGACGASAGDEAFTAVDGKGYLCGRIHDRLFRAHRVCFALAKGYWPVGQTDHKDGDRQNNRARNLRDATNSQNGANRASKPGSSSQYLGVTWDRERSLWAVKVKKDGTYHNLPRRLCETAAALDRDRLAQKLHGEFARLNVNA